MANQIDGYIRGYDGDVCARLEQIRTTIERNAPDAVEAMSYGMPTYKLGGKNLIHFAAGKHHIGIYPSPPAVEYFAKQLEGYKTSKGTIQFQNDEPLPLDLLEQIVKHRVATLGGDTFPMK